MAYECLRFEIKNSVAHCTLNRPDRLNSFNLRMATELQDALQICQRDSGIRAVLLTGAGRGFCAGQDLSEFQPQSGQAAKLPKLGKVIAECYNPIVRKIRSLEKPVVCAVNGVAAGAGANLAFCCDITLASKDANFIQSFSKVGLIPDCGGSFFLPRLVGLARATALAMLGEKISAEQARDFGLIYKVCAAEELLPQTAQLAEQLAKQPTRGLGLTKRALNASFSNSLDVQLELEQELQGLAGESADFAEGVQAFFEKRAPQFSGK